MAYFETVNQGNSGNENWPTQDLADGIPGESTPTVCLQVGGRDSSGILHAFLTDNSGQLHVLVENTPTVEAILQGTPTVAITGSISASFSPTGTQVVFVENTVAVQGTIDAIASIVNTPQVLIENTPSVNATLVGTPTVAITGSISASFSPTGTQVVFVENTVAVQGTIDAIASIVNTPQVLIENTPNVIASVTNTPQIAGTVALTGQPIAVDGTVAVIGSLIVTATVSGTCSVLSSNAVVATAIPSLSAGQRVPLTVDVAGACRVNPYNTGSVQSPATNGTATNGTILTLTVPAGEKYLIQAVRVTLATSSNTGSRQIVIYYSDANANAMLENVAIPTQTSSLTWIYSAGPGLPAATAALSSLVTVPMPGPILIGPGFTIGAEVVGSAGIKDSVSLEALVIVYED